MYLKKSLGQHFLRDEDVLKQIAAAIGDFDGFETVIEIGPGAGALTKYVVRKAGAKLHLVELDDRWVELLAKTFPALATRIHHEDILQLDLEKIGSAPVHVFGNFPYNISTQIVFKIIDHRDRITQMTGMFQKEVAVRIAAPPGSRDYGVMSVLTQAYYDCTYLFDVSPQSFDPPPKVMSGIIQLKRRATDIQCDEKKFKMIVKKAFNQRRKTMRNSLKDIIQHQSIFELPIFNKRPEQLSVQDFVELTNLIVKSSQES